MSIEFHPHLIVMGLRPTTCPLCHRPVTILPKREGASHSQGSVVTAPWRSTTLQAMALFEFSTYTGRKWPNGISSRPPFGCCEEIEAATILKRGSPD